MQSGGTKDERGFAAAGRLRMSRIARSNRSFADKAALALLATLAAWSIFLPFAYAQDSVVETPTSPVAGNAPSPKPQSGTGIAGSVTDSKTGEALIEATLQLTHGGEQKTLTDVDGNYILELPPGTYDLKVYYELYQGRRITGVVVEPDRLTTLNIVLTADKDAVEEVVVEAKADTRKEAAVLKERQRAVAASDVISAQEIARTPDSNASDAVKRMVSATVVGNRYVMIRGLGGRYSTTLLNGVLLPSPDPDQRAVPLDLFPAGLLANMTVDKTYSADLPGTFAGGALKIETNSYPTALEAKLKASVSADTVSTFRDRLTYRGGSADYIGFDDGTRRLPGGVPKSQPVLLSETLDAKKIEEIGESFKNVWTTRRATAWPNWGFSGSVGDTRAVGGAKVGYTFNLGISHKEAIEKASVAKVKFENDELQYRENVASEAGVESAGLNGLANVGVKPDGRNELNLFLLFTHTGEKRGGRVTGYNETDGKNIEATRLVFTERWLVFTQLVGDHRLPSYDDIKLRWQGNYSFVNRDEPDTRDIVYQLIDEEKSRYKNEPGSGERYFSSMTDHSGGGGADLTFPLPKVGSLEVGGGAQYSARDYWSRRFRFNFVGRRDPAPLFLPADQIFTPETIGPSFQLNERTLPQDAFDAGLLVAFGYAALDLTLLDPVRIVPGVRYERSAQTLQAGTPNAITAEEPGDVDRTYDDVLPSLNVIYAIRPDMNLRAAYSYTLARPQFREIAPFLYFDFMRRRSLSGNPDLVETRIHNADLRWEWFFAESELLSAGFFYKHFVDPIEQVVVDATQGDVSFTNTPAANLYGGEIEARASFGHFTPYLQDLHIGLNTTLIYSRIDVGDSQGPQTNRTRPLQGMSSYVINASLGYLNERIGTEVSLSYNVFGPRIAEVGFDRLPDVYEQPFHRLDLSASQALGAGFKLKLSGANLLDQATTYKQGGLTVYRIKPGFTGSLALEWSY
ncbi:MAG: TonB-dependent receptor [Myxococcales bacterium]|nr:MAG: TonB-dependent receptor [Myxococcales bacterium]